ncbi:MAG: biotin/lipoyl-containing protein, partial [Burkholderiaceae bacterium]
MAIVDVKVPQLSESVAEATLLQWKKKPGEAVAADEILIEIETDKVVLEVPAPASGVLSEIVKSDGGTVISAEVIARIDTEAKSTAAAAPAKSAAPVAPAAAAPTPAAPSSVTRPGAPIAMPSAAKLMAETGVSLSQGSGKDGRITKADVMAAQKTGGSAPTVSAGQPSGLPAVAVSAGLPQPSISLGPDAQLEGRPEQRVPMSRLRARIAERLLQSQATNAILTTFNEVNMAPLMAMRKQYGERFEKEHGVKL